MRIAYDCCSLEPTIQYLARKSGCEKGSFVGSIDDVSMAAKMLIMIGIGPTEHFRKRGLNIQFDFVVASLKSVDTPECEILLEIQYP